MTKRTTGNEDIECMQVMCFCEIFNHQLISEVSPSVKLHRSTLDWIFRNSTLHGWANFGLLKCRDLCYYWWHSYYPI